MWKINEKELKNLKLNNPKLYSQIAIDEVEEKNEDIKIKSNDQLRLARVDYAVSWSMQHPLLAKIIKILLDFGGYDDTKLEGNK